VNNNKISDGHPFNLAAWQYASVLYLQRVKSNYAGTWRKMLSGTGKYGDVGKLFLAHHDRFSFLLRLYIDTNDITFRNGFRQKETQEARSRTGRALGKDDVIGQLRAALASGSGSTPTPGSSPTPTLGSSPRPTPGPSPTPTPGTSPTPAPGSCSDKSGSCNTFVRDGACSRAPEWMRDNCRLSCGWCGSGSTPTPGTSPTPTPGSCNDKSGSCNTFVRDGACSRAPEWMRDNCRRSCGWC